ncbi:hypothetical protein NH340_JMT03307 [Sarcoptes scabiei]|nr:hypothetical protein NH340_JMT03307 [Sarcoptes scabiei]
MVISLDNEISHYEPYGRTMLELIPNQKSTIDDEEDGVHNELLDDRHQTTFNNDFIPAELDSTRDLFRSIADDAISINSKTLASNDFWHIKKSPRGEEEIYVNGNLLICSHKASSNDSTSFLDHSMTFNEAIIDAVWCDFRIENDLISRTAKEFPMEFKKCQTHSSIDLEETCDCLVSEIHLNSRSRHYKPLNVLQTLCILDQCSLHIISKSGDHFRKLLPFRVQKIIATDYGLLLQKLDLLSFQTFFSLSNPLGDLHPVLFNETKSSQSRNLVLIDYIPEKKLVFSFCNAQKTHKIFRLRSLKEAQIDWNCSISQQSSKFPQKLDSSPDFISTPNNHDTSKKLQLGNLNAIPVNLLNILQQQQSHFNLNHQQSVQSPHHQSSGVHLMNSSPYQQSRRSFSICDTNTGMTTTTTATNINSNLTHNNRILFDLVSSRMDSPVSPNLNHHQQYFSTTDRLLDFDFDSFHQTNNSGSLNVNVSKNFRSFKTPTFSSPLLISSSSLSMENQKMSEKYSEWMMEHVWTESINRFSPSNKASKIFYTKDFLDTQYLCYLVAQTSILKILNYDEASAKARISIEPAQNMKNQSNNIQSSNSANSTKSLIYEIKTLSVCDAEPLPSMDMMIILDANKTLNLYSGVNKVAIVHLQSNACVLKSFQSVHSDNSENRNIHRLSDSPGFYSDQKSLQTPLNSFDVDLIDFSPDVSHLRKRIYHASSPIGCHRESKKLDSIIENFEVDYDENLSFSILPYPSFGSVVSLRDAIDNRVTFITEKGQLYRLSLPLISSTLLVRKCLAALRCVLPREIMFRFIKSWYTFRNSTRVEIFLTEIVLFKLCIFTCIGFEQQEIEKFLARKDKTLIRNPSNLKQSPDSIDDHEESICKRIKIEEDPLGTDDDFYQMLSDDNIRLPSVTDSSAKFNQHRLKAMKFFGPSFLYPYQPHILFALHLIYEDLKLIQMNWTLCKDLLDFLYILSIHLDLKSYQDHYCRDFFKPCTEIELKIDPIYSENSNKIIYPNYFENDTPSIYQRVHQFLNADENKINNMKAFPFIAEDNDGRIVTPNIYNIIMLYSNLLKKPMIFSSQILTNIADNFINNKITLNENSKKSIYKVLNQEKNGFGFDYEKFDHIDKNEKVLFLISSLGVTLDYLKQLSFGIALPLWDLISDFRYNPKNDWCYSIYSLIDRPDLLALVLPPNRITDKFSHFSSFKDEMSSQIFSQELDYLDNSVLRLLFPNDHRLHEAYQMLISNKPIPINIKQENGMADADFAEEQEKCLLALTLRTMALPLGRGIVTLRSYSPIVVEKFQIPSLVLQGKASSRQYINLNHIDIPPNMNIWPLFHNGVAAGLRISSTPNRMIDSSWILFNKPINTSSTDEHYEHAGFLLALGLNGLLDELSIMDLHDYLSKGNDLTKVAILLGLAASRRGTMDSTAYVLLGIHLEGLLPSTSTELDVSPVVKVAAVLGTGLLFQGTGHRYIAEVMLNEIGRPPGPEMDHYIDRESYALSAGLAFGLVALGRGNELINVITSDGISIPDQLNHYMLGVHKKMSTLQKEKSKMPNYHIREGDCINADVTSPGATIALGLMFFNTANKAILEWLNVPDTQNLLETVRPDFLLMRVLAKNLIMWSEIKPTSQWIESHIPSIIYDNAFQRFNNTEKTLENEAMFLDNIDYETMTQSYCNIIAGACFALALRYAGSANEQAFEVVYKYTYKMVTLIQKGNISQIEQAGRSTIESCVNVLIVSCAIIMAGTGNVEVMRICRFLRSRVNQVHVLYGSFMAIHMALGLLFLGGCKMTLNNSPESVCALICAFYPKFPIHTNDNRYHLQAFRHLYVLASEPRLLIPKCIDTGSSIYASIRLIFRDKTKSPLDKMAPCLLPDLDSLESLELVDKNYWNISFRYDKNFDKLINLLKANGNIYIKRKIKGLSYSKKFVYNSNHHRSSVLKKSTDLAKSTADRMSFTLFDFTNEAILKAFSQTFTNGSDCSEQELLIKNRVSSILYECAEDETLDLFVPLIQLIVSGASIVQSKTDSFIRYDQIFSKENCFLNPGYKYFIIWQIRLASQYLEKLGKKKENKYRLINTIKTQIEDHVENSCNKIKLRDYLTGMIPIQELDETVVDLIVYHNVPNQKFLPINGATFYSVIQQLRRMTQDMSTSFFLYHLLTDK